MDIAPLVVPKII